MRLRSVLFTDCVAASKSWHWLDTGSEYLLFCLNVFLSLSEFKQTRHHPSAAPLQSLSLKWIRLGNVSLLILENDFFDLNTVVTILFHLILLSKKYKNLYRKNVYLIKRSCIASQYFGSSNLKFVNLKRTIVVELVSLCPGTRKSFRLAGNADVSLAYKSN